MRVHSKRLAHYENLELTQEIKDEKIRELANEYEGDIDE